MILILTKPRTIVYEPSVLNINSWNIYIIVSHIENQFRLIHLTNVYLRSIHSIHSIYHWKSHIICMRNQNKNTSKFMKTKPTKAFHPSPYSAAYMRQWIRSALVQIMPCDLIGANSLSKPMLVYCQLNPLGKNFSEVLIKYKTFYSGKCIWIYRLRNGGHFVQERWVKRMDNFSFIAAFWS